MKNPRYSRGFSHFSTTANFYAHLEFDFKRESANAIGGRRLVSEQVKSIDAKHETDPKLSSLGLLHPTLASQHEIESILLPSWALAG